MSTTRITPRTAWVKARDLPKGPNGRALCRTCGTEVSGRRRTFCRDACVDAWAVRHSPTLLRRRVFHRDHGICALCGIDSALLGKALRAEWQRVKQARSGQERHERAEFRKRYRWFFRHRTCWDADHILPVVEGGGDCDISNIRTLCVPCHQQVTKDLARRRASQRRREKRGHWVMGVDG